MKKYLVVLSMLILLTGCTSTVTDRTVSSDSPTKTSDISINFGEQYKDVQSIGLFESVETKGDLKVGRFHYIKDANKKAFAQALSTSRIVDRSKKDSINDKFSLVVVADGTIISYKYLPGESLIQTSKDNRFYSVSSELLSMINQTIEDKNMDNPNTLVYKGIPYFGLALAESINSNELITIGEVNKTTYYVKKNTSQPVDLIYCIIGKNSSPKDNYTYSAYQMLQAVKR